MSEHWPRRPALSNTAVNGMLLAAMCVLITLESATSAGLIALSIASWVPLLFRHRYPLAVVAAATAVDGARLGIFELRPPEPFTVLPIATIVAVATLAANRRPAVSWPAGLIAAGTLLLTGLTRQQHDHLAELMFMVDVVVGATAAGYLTQVRRKRYTEAQRRADLAERSRDEEARRQVAAERVRIARELHDVLAHHLTLVNAQAGVAEHLLRSDPDTAATALQGITTHTRQALDEVQVTIGLLRGVLDETTADASADGGDDELTRLRHPTPTAADLPGLVGTFRNAGGLIDVATAGQPTALAPSSDLAAYRIVQESLTNARKHAPGVPVDLSVTWSHDSLHLTVRNARPQFGAALTEPSNASNPDAAVFGGHGLIGMRERALAAGGSLTAEPDPAGGFVVTAVLPIASTSSIVTKGAL